jgi:hypothetical protein
MTKIAIVGYRNYYNYNEFKIKIDEILKDYQDNLMIISGGASGTDAMAKRYAIENKIIYKEHTAEWNKYGMSAGPIRNKKIVEDSDIVIAFVSKYSKGTINTVNEANKSCKKTIIIQL